MGKLIEEFTKNCIACRANTGHTAVPPIKSTQLPKASKEFSAIDFTSKIGNNYIFFYVDLFSRYPVGKFTKGLTSADAIKALKLIFEELGVPNQVKSDNGPAFISNEFASFAEEMGFEHLKITPLHPPANSTAERFMGNLNKSVRCANITGENHKEVIDAFIKTYRATPHPSTGFTPNELMGFEDDINIPSINKWIDPKMMGKFNKMINKLKNE